MIVKFSIWDESEGQVVKPVKVCTGVIGHIPKFEVRCNLKRDQLKNKELIDNIFNILKGEGIIEDEQRE